MEPIRMNFFVCLFWMVTLVRSVLHFSDIFFWEVLNSVHLDVLSMIKPTLPLWQCLCSHKSWVSKALLNHKATTIWMALSRFKIWLLWTIILTGCVLRELAYDNYLCKLKWCLRDDWDLEHCCPLMNIKKKNQITIIFGLFTKDALWLL